MDVGKLAAIVALMVACAGTQSTPTSAPPTAASAPPTTASTSPAGTATAQSATALASSPAPAAGPTQAAAKPAPASAPAPTPTQPTVVMKLVRSDGASRDVRVELALTEAQRERGLMERPSIPDDTGMLFVFPTDVNVAFWMKDTPTPLSIAFIASDGRIVDIQDMQPETTDLHQPPSTYRYALEAAQGYFGRVGVKGGDRAVLPPLPPAS